MRGKRAQVALELALALTAVLVLLVGILKVWVWMTVTLLERHEAYEATRVTAATPPNYWDDDHPPGEPGKDNYYRPRRLDLFR